MENKQYLYQGFTLVDITPTGQTRHRDDRVFERSQQRNYETVVQILSLRTQIKMLDCWTLEKDVSNYQFGISHTGKHRIWSFLFSVEYPGIFQLGADSYGTLRQDFQLIPVITELHETASFEKNIFYTSGPNNNIYFKYSN